MINNQSPVIILGIDPGTARMGFGIVVESDNKISAREFGTLTTAAQLEEHQRLAELYQQLVQLIKRHKPDVIAVEDIFFAKNQKTVIRVSQARGIALLAATHNKKPVYSFTPLQVKQAVTGWGGAEKRQVQEMVKNILCLNETPKPDDAADALAVAICGVFSQKILSQLNRQ